MTATTSAARDHARSQAGQHEGPMPVIPASAWPNPPVDAAAMVWAETVPGGRYSSKVLARGTRLRLTDLDGRGCAHLMLWRADAPWERLNIADTVKVPWQAYLGVDHPLLDDQGRVLATVVADTSGRHDALCGTTTAAANTARYGDGSAHSTSPAGRELLTLAALKHGLGPRDVAPTVSFFHGVRADDDGALVATGNAGPGTSVELLLHLPLIVAVANTAHPLDESPTFDTTAIELLAWRAPADLAELAARAPEIGPEYDRAHRNTEDVHAAALPTEGTPR